MVRECRDAGVKLFVVKQNRLNATMQLLKKAIDASASAASTWSRSTCSGPARRATTTRHWRGRWDMDGGAFMNQASHYVDMVDWLVGPVDNVHAYTATQGRDIEAEDTGVMSLRLRATGAGEHQRDDADLTRRTSRARSRSWASAGSVRIGGVAVNDIQHWVFDAPPRRRADPRRQLRHHLGLRLRPSALLRQRHRTLRGEARRGRRLQRPALAGGC